MNALTTIRDKAKAVLAIANKALEFGPRAPEFVAHIQNGLAEFQAAATMIGLAADEGYEVSCTVEDAVSECPELGEKLSELGGGDGVSGPWFDLVSQLLSNPVLMQVLLAYLKIKV